MKITCSRYDELKAKRDQYKAAAARYNEAYDDAISRHDADERLKLDPIEDMLVSELSKFNILSFDVRVETSWRNGIKVSISCNEDDKFNPKNALAWSYTAELNRKSGEVKRESSSWSGLNAVTEEQLNSLRQTYEALRYLNSINWSEVLNVELPKFEEYTKDIGERPAEEVSERELDEALLESLIGQNKAIAIRNPNSERSRWDPNYYFAQILKDSGSQYTVEFVGAGRFSPINEQTQQNAIDAFRRGSTWSRRIRKDKIDLYHPKLIIEF